MSSAQPQTNSDVAHIDKNLASSSSSVSGGSKVSGLDVDVSKSDPAQNLSQGTHFPVSPNMQHETGKYISNQLYLVNAIISSFNRV